MKKQSFKKGADQKAAPMLLVMTREKINQFLKN